MFQSACAKIGVLFLAVGLQCACGTGGGGATSSTPSPQSGPPAPSSQPSSYQLMVTVNGSGNGTISSAPPGIQCPGTCGATFSSGTQVTLTPTAANDGSIFAGWNGACSGSQICSSVVSGPVAVSATFNASLQSIKHIIFMLQENRSFDEYFGKMNDYRLAQGLPADVDGLPSDASNPSADGATTIASFHMRSMCVENANPGWKAAHVAFNRDDPTSTTGLNNGFVLSSAIFAQQNNLSDRQGIRAMGYYDGNDLPYYYFMASQFAMSDRWFSPVMAETDPNRMYVMAATSAGHAYPLNDSGAPQLGNKTIFQLLQESGVSWKIYVTDPNPTPLLGSDASMFAFSRNYRPNFAPISQYFSDLANNSLPAVAMIDPGWQSGRDEHPADSDGTPGGSIQYGAKWVSSLINALMASSSWGSSVFILSYDEYGGYYEHVPAQPAVSPDGKLPSDLHEAGDLCNTGNGTASGVGSCNFVFTGFRVPIMIISPFSRRHFVSHTTADHTAILKFIETRFNLSSLTNRDAAQMDMTEFFDFANKSWKVPPSPPLQPTNGPCYLTTLP